MIENWRAIVYMLSRAPFLIMGLLLIGASGAFSFHLLLKLERAGDKSYREGIYLPGSMWLTIPRVYRRHVQKDAWPMWPLHMTWLCLLIGVAFVVFGLFQLG